MAQDPPISNIPVFRLDGYLPEGVYVCSEAEVIFRFGSSGRRRRRLALRLRRWIELGRQVGARRLLADGSFVTAKEEPQDIDTVILLPEDFTQQLQREYAPALELEEMLLTRRPEELFAAEDEIDWEEWVDFFSRTREPDGRRKGLVEIRL
jgi:Family of unknown function (DUF6932)